MTRKFTLIAALLMLFTLSAIAQADKYLIIDHHVFGHIACLNDDFDRQGFLPVYQFDWYDKDRRRIKSQRTEITACLIAPPGAAFVRVLVWGKKSGRIITLLRYYRPAPLDWD